MRSDDKAREAFKLFKQRVGKGSNGGGFTLRVVELLESNVDTRIELLHTGTHGLALAMYQNWLFA